jgi:hypothetical protein
VKSVWPGYFSMVRGSAMHGLSSSATEINKVVNKRGILGELGTLGG